MYVQKYRNLSQLIKRLFIIPLEIHFIFSLINIQVVWSLIRSHVNEKSTFKFAKGSKIFYVSLTDNYQLFIFPCYSDDGEFSSPKFEFQPRTKLRFDSSLKNY